MSARLDDYRRAVLDQLADLPGRELRLARETIDDWLAEREGDDLPSPAAYAGELRASLRAGRAAPHQRFGRWLRANWLPVTVFGTIAVVSTWWLTLDADVTDAGGYATSKTIPHRTYRATSFDFNGVTMFQCRAGELEINAILISDREILVKDIRFGSLDREHTAWGDATRRIGAELQPMVGDGQYRPVKNTRLDATGANVRLRYRFDRCPQPMGGGVSHPGPVEITYRLYGKTRTETVELMQRIGFTGCRLAETDVEC